MTLQEIIEAAKKDPALQKSVAVWAKDTTDGQELLNSFAKLEVDKAIAEKTSEIHTSYDNDLFEILGTRKKNDQKTYDFVKEIATKFKELSSAAPDDKDKKVKELQDKIKQMNEDGSHNDHWKKTYEEALAKWNERETELNNTIKSKDEESLRTQVSNDLRAGLAGLTFKEGIEQDVIDAMINVHEAKILASAKLVDGKVVYSKEDGTPWMNKEIKPITSKEIWGDKLVSIIGDKTTTRTGGDAASNVSKGSIVETGEGDNAKKKLVLDSSTFSTKLEFNKVAEKTLRGLGITADQKEFTEMLDGAYDEYGVSELEMQ